MIVLKNVCLRSGRQWKRFLTRQSLRARPIEFSASDLSFLYWARSLVALVCGLTHDQSAEVLRLDVVVAEYFRHGGWDGRRKLAERQIGKRPEGQEEDVGIEPRRAKGEACEVSWGVYPPISVQC